MLKLKKLILLCYQWHTTWRLLQAVSSAKIGFVQAVWSGLSLSAYKIIGYCRRYWHRILCLTLYLLFPCFLFLPQQPQKELLVFYPYFPDYVLDPHDYQLSFFSLHLFLNLHITPFTGWHFLCPNKENKFPWNAKIMWINVWQYKEDFNHKRNNLVFYIQDFVWYIFNPTFRKHFCMYFSGQELSVYHCEQIRLNKMHNQKKILLT